MTAFRYHRPDTIEEALALLHEHGAEAKVLAGGQSLLPVMAMRLASPAQVIDIGRLPGRGLIVRPGGPMGDVSVGALVRHAEAEDSAELAKWSPLMAQAMPLIGHRAIRHRGTVCGSLAHADPAAELPAVALALGMEFVLRTLYDERTVAADAFFRGFLTTAIADNELLTEVRFPTRRPGEGSAIHEMSRRHGDYAVAGVAVNVRLADDGTCASAAIALFGVGSTAVRVAEAEAILVGQAPSSAAMTASANEAATRISPSSDANGTTAFRKHLVRALTDRALRDAFEHASQRRNPKPGAHV